MQAASAAERIPEFEDRLCLAEQAAGAALLLVTRLLERDPAIVQTLFGQAEFRQALMRQSGFPERTTLGIEYLVQAALDAAAETQQAGSVPIH